MNVFDTVLILVRHGATRANLMQPYRLQGLRPDGRLAETGKRQADALGKTLARFPVAALYCSPLLRARQTARFIIDKRRIPKIIEKSIIEADLGEWSGCTWPEVEKRWPKEYRAFHRSPERHGYLGGENLTDVRRRVVPAVERLLSRHAGQTIVVVSHGVVNRVLLAGWLKLPLRYGRQIPQDNAAYNVIEFTDGKAKVRTVNAAEHLLALSKAA